MSHFAQMIQFEHDLMRRLGCNLWWGCVIPGHPFRPSK